MNRFFYAIAAFAGMIALAVWLPPAAPGLETVSALPIFGFGGMIINQGTLQGIYKSFRTIFNEAFAGVKPLYTRIATVVPSSTREETYAWLGAFPKLREWVGDRAINSLKAFGYTIKNKDFEATVEVDRNDIQDDQIGVYKPLFSEMGRSAAAHPDELVFALLPLGLTTICYDGQYFFDTDHPVGDTVASNFGGGAGTTWYLLDTTRAIKPFIFQERKKPEFTALDNPDDERVFMKKKYLYGVDSRDNAGFGLWQLAYASRQPLDPANYAAARAAMMSLKDDFGKPLGIQPNLLVFPPTLESAARKLLLNELDGAGGTNEWKGSAEPLVVPWL